MAKISTYSTVPPALSDMLIGTDVSDLNATKNFTVGQLLSLPGSTTYVPYTGATASVDLGANDITSNSFIIAGGLSSEFLKADGSVDSTAYLPTATAASTYVPYTGATGDVTLGAHQLTALGLTITTDNVEIPGISCSVSDFFIIGSNGYAKIGFILDFINDIYKIGDYLSSGNGTYININDASQYIELSAALYSGGGVGTAGQVLTSQGTGTPATWETPADVWTNVTITINPNSTSYTDGRPSTLNGSATAGTNPVVLLPLAGAGKYYIYEYDLEVPSATSFVNGPVDYYYIGTSGDSQGNAINPSSINSVVDIAFSMGNRNAANSAIGTTVINSPATMNNSVVFTTLNDLDPTSVSGLIKIKMRYMQKTFG